MAIGHAGKEFHFVDISKYVDGTRAGYAPNFIDCTGFHHLTFHVRSDMTTAPASAISFYLEGANHNDLPNSYMPVLPIDRHVGDGTASAGYLTVPSLTGTCILTYRELPKYVRPVLLSYGPSGMVGTVRVHAHAWIA